MEPSDLLLDLHERLTKIETSLEQMNHFFQLHITHVKEVTERVYEIEKDLAVRRSHMNVASKLGSFVLVLIGGSIATVLNHLWK